MVSDIKCKGIRSFHSTNFQICSDTHYSSVHNSFLMPSTFITTDDLRDFKLELLDDIRNLITGPKAQKIKKYLKSYEVREMLNISTGTLHNLRVNGTLPYTRVGNILLYDQSDIINILEANKINV